VLPIAIGIGAGAELRQPLGIALVGGLLVSQFVTLYLTPTIYVVMEQLAARARRFGEHMGRRRKREWARREVDHNGVDAARRDDSSGVLPHDIVQKVVYVGAARWQPETAIRHPNLDFRFEYVDASRLGARRCWKSGDLGDAIIAVLCADGTNRM